MSLTQSEGSSDQNFKLKPGDYAALIGIVWGDQSHAIAMSVRENSTIESFTLEHSAESLHDWPDKLQLRFGGHPGAVAVEASRGAIVSALLERPWLVIYPIHPATSTRFRNAFSPWAQCSRDTSSGGLRAPAKI